MVVQVCVTQMRFCLSLVQLVPPKKTVCLEQIGEEFAGPIGALTTILRLQELESFTVALKEIKAAFVKVGGPTGQQAFILVQARWLEVNEHIGNQGEEKKRSQEVRPDVERLSVHLEDGEGAVPVSIVEYAVAKFQVNVVALIIRQVSVVEITNIGLFLHRNWFLFHLLQLLIWAGTLPAWASLLRRWGR